MRHGERERGGCKILEKERSRLAFAFPALLCFALLWSALCSCRPTDRQTDRPAQRHSEEAARPSRPSRPAPPRQPNSPPTRHRLSPQSSRGFSVSQFAGRSSSVNITVFVILVRSRNLFLSSLIYFLPKNDSSPFKERERQRQRMKEKWFTALCTCYFLCLLSISPLF